MITPRPHFLKSGHIFRFDMVLWGLTRFFFVSQISITIEGLGSQGFIWGVVKNDGPFSDPYYNTAPNI